eukprot:TRINITY_DN21997_c0_g1_i1.p1 TRINITY_DN21997_c0_g1~~TRINITY_DN21997_c0_g1_i1.p1  ORF type:complete len:261 (-),score=39.33 TRINITY_DN21997_c0_g1_i1:87-827(-)
MGATFRHKLSRWTYKFPELYIGITTGGYGSITTFSSWNYESSALMIRYREPVNGLLALFIGFSGTMLLNAAGYDFAGIPLFRWRSSSDLSRPWTKRSGKENAAFITSIIVAFLSVILIIALVAWGSPSQRPNALACLGSPFGALVRWKLCKMNKKNEIPWWTFLVNVSGTLIYAIINGLLSIYPTQSDAIIQGILLTGVMGGYTTVSTFIAEISALKKEKSYVYGFISIGGVQLLLLLINGLFFWL